jgi:pyrophosphatase PpaX
MNNGKLHVKGIMFDLDGTILDTKPAYVEAARIAFKALGQEMPEIAAALEIPKRMEQKQPINDIVKVNPESFLGIYLKSFYSISASKTKPFPNVANTLALLSNRAKLAVITMRYVPCKTIDSELKQFNLNNFFAHIVTALDTHKPKPSPEALIKAVTAMDVDMCDCVIVGDSVVDVAAGRAAGAKTVSVLTGLYSREELSKAKPDFIINGIADLFGLLV